MKNHSNTVTHTHTQNDNSSETKLKVREYCNLTDREFKIAGMKKLNKLQENSKRHFNELRNKINEQRNNLSKRLNI